MAIKDAAVLRTPNSRFNLAIVAFIAFAILVFGFLLLHGKKTTGPIQANSNLSNAQGIRADNTPGTSGSAEFNNLQNEANKEHSEAVANGKKNNVASIPTLTNAAPPSSFANPGKTTLPSAPLATPAAPAIPQAPPQAQQNAPSAPTPQQNAALAADLKNRQDEVHKKMDEDIKSIDDRVKYYLGQNSVNEPDVEVAYKKEPAAVEKEKEKSGTAASGSSSGDNEVMTRIAYAGDILPSVLINGINSDYKGPILARVIGGPLDQAVATGEYKTSYEGVVMHFTQLSSTKFAKAIQLDAYAISPDTSMYGIASDVNHHYLTNLGFIFGAALLQGYGEAAERQNTTTSTSALGSTSTQGQLSNSQQLQAGLGTAGQALGQTLQQQGQRPTTITVDAKIVVGLLLTSDLTVGN